MPHRKFWKKAVTRRAAVGSPAGKYEQSPVSKQTQCPVKRTGSKSCQRAGTKS